MERIEFNNEAKVQYVSTQPKISKLVKLVMKFGVSDPAKANFVLLIVAIFIFIISIILINRSSEEESKPVITDREQIIIQMNYQ